MQLEDIFKKQQRSSKTHKKAVVDNVEIVYQGYELKAIYRLIGEGYSIQDIVIGRGKIPNFIYEYDGKFKKYYPDIFIPKDNRIIEVKSTWTYLKDEDRNLAKGKAVVESGYKFDFYIMTR